mmetsp:Transcript_26771/g.66602  ORF Transcript_26771/g.66602 Transcript_26771/m.66602 type:complete len:209 (+) Transcript_26771:923-1549(+)
MWGGRSSPVCFCLYSQSIRHGTDPGQRKEQAKQGGEGSPAHHTRYEALTPPHSIHYSFNSTHTNGCTSAKIHRPSLPFRLSTPPLPHPLSEVSDRLASPSRPCIAASWTCACPCSATSCASSSSCASLACASGGDAPPRCPMRKRTSCRTHCGRHPLPPRPRHPRPPSRRAWPTSWPYPPHRSASTPPGCGTETPNDQAVRICDMRQV